MPTLNFLLKSKIQIPTTFILIAVFFTLMENPVVLQNFQTQVLSTNDQPIYKINDDTFHGDLPTKIRYDAAKSWGFKKRGEEDADI